MFFCEQVNTISIVQSIFKVLCLAISFVLIYQLIIAFVVEKPTTATNLDEELQITDLPEVVVCMDPGFNSSALTKYGYDNDAWFYWKGTRHLSENSFVGWNGDKYYNKSSHEIMEESLLFPPESQGLLLYANFTDVFDDSKNASVTLRMLIFPFGRCMVISPPSQENSGNFKPNRLSLGFNDTFLNQSKLRLFFMDNRNSPKFNPDDMEMVGNQIEIELGHSVISLFRTRISRFEHFTGDPLFDCNVYTTDNSYEDCIRRDLKETFQKKIGCQPPPFA